MDATAPKRKPRTYKHGWNVDAPVIVVSPVRRFEDTERVFNGVIIGATIRNIRVLFGEGSDIVSEFTVWETGAPPRDRAGRQLWLSVAERNTTIAKQRAHAALLTALKSWQWSSRPTLPAENYIEAARLLDLPLKLEVL